MSRVVGSMMVVVACSFRPAIAPEETVGSPDGLVFVFDPATACPAAYVAIAGQASRYRIGTLASFRPASEACNADAPGFTHLVVLGDLAEARAIRAIERVFWTGVVQMPNQRDPASHWYAITGEPAVPLWQDGEPNNSDEPEPNYSNVAKYDEDGLDDDEFDELRRPVCECDGRPVDPVVERYVP